MNLQLLKRINKISEEIENCEANIKRANYTQNEEVVIRETYLKVNGLNESIEVPKSLFRIVGKLILSEYQQKLIELENELMSI
jgi:hypothetical protein